MMVRKYPKIFPKHFLIFPKHKALLDPLWDEASNTSVSKDTQLLFLEKYDTLVSPGSPMRSPYTLLDFSFLFFWAPVLLLTPILKPVESFLLNSSSASYQLILKFFAEAKPRLLLLLMEILEKPCWRQQGTVFLLMPTLTSLWVCPSSIWSIVGCSSVAVQVHCHALCLHVSAFSQRLV